MKNKWSRRERLYEVVKYDPNTGQKSSEWFLASGQSSLRYEHGLPDVQVVKSHKWATVEVDYDDHEDEIFFVVRTDSGEEWRVDRGDSNYEHFCRILAGPRNEILNAIRKDNEERYGDC